MEGKGRGIGGGCREGLGVCVWGGGLGMEEPGSDMKMGTVDVPRVLELGLGW